MNSLSDENYSFFLAEYSTRKWNVNGKIIFIAGREEERVKERFKKRAQKAFFCLFILLLFSEHCKAKDEKPLRDKNFSTVGEVCKGEFSSASKNKRAE